MIEDQENFDDKKNINITNLLQRNLNKSIDEDIEEYGISTNELDILGKSKKNKSLENKNDLEEEDFRDELLDGIPVESQYYAKTENTRYDNHDNNSSSIRKTTDYNNKFISSSTNLSFFCSQSILQKKSQNNNHKILEKRSLNQNDNIINYKEEPFNAEFNKFTNNAKHSNLKEKDNMKDKKPDIFSKSISNITSSVKIMEKNIKTTEKSVEKTMKRVLSSEDKKVSNCVNLQEIQLNLYDKKIKNNNINKNNKSNIKNIKTTKPISMILEDECTFNSSSHNKSSKKEGSIIKKNENETNRILGNIKSMQTPLISKRKNSKTNLSENKWTINEKGIFNLKAKDITSKFKAKTPLKIKENSLSSSKTPMSKNLATTDIKLSVKTAKTQVQTRKQSPVCSQIKLINNYNKDLINANKNNNFYSPIASTTGYFNDNHFTHKTTPSTRINSVNSNKNLQSNNKFSQQKSKYSYFSSEKSSQVISKKHSKDFSSGKNTKTNLLYKGNSNKAELTSSNCDFIENNNQNEKKIQEQIKKLISPLRKNESNTNNPVFKNNNIYVKCKDENYLKSKNSVILDSERNKIFIYRDSQNRNNFIQTKKVNVIPLQNNKIPSNNTNIMKKIIKTGSKIKNLINSRYISPDNNKSSNTNNQFKLSNKIDSYRCNLNNNNNLKNTVKNKVNISKEHNYDEIHIKTPVVLENNNNFDIDRKSLSITKISLHSSLINKENNINNSIKNIQIDKIKAESEYKKLLKELHSCNNTKFTSENTIKKQEKQSSKNNIFTLYGLGNKGMGGVIANSRNNNCKIYDFSNNRNNNIGCNNISQKDYLEKDSKCLSGKNSSLRISQKIVKEGINNNIIHTDYLKNNTKHNQKVSKSILSSSSIIKSENLNLSNSNLIDFHTSQIQNLKLKINQINKSQDKIKAKDSISVIKESNLTQSKDKSIETRNILVNSQNSKGIKNIQNSLNSNLNNNRFQNNYYNNVYKTELNIIYQNSNEDFPSSNSKSQNKSSKDRNKTNSDVKEIKDFGEMIQIGGLSLTNFNVNHKGKQKSTEYNKNIIEELNEQSFCEFEEYEKRNHELNEQPNLKEKINLQNYPLGNYYQHPIKTQQKQIEKFINPGEQVENIKTFVGFNICNTENPTEGKQVDEQSNKAYLLSHHIHKDINHVSNNIENDYNLNSNCKVENNIVDDDVLCDLIEDDFGNNSLTDYYKRNPFSEKDEKEKYSTDKNITTKQITQNKKDKINNNEIIQIETKERHKESNLNLISNLSIESPEEMHIITIKLLKLQSKNAYRFEHLDIMDPQLTFDREEYEKLKKNKQIANDDDYESDLSF